uniref:SCP domain-containing protein n=1 Tax=Strongyloides venezuelensis TaxID=75913 RepID=A0A0K0FJB7_STRVS
MKCFLTIFLLLIYFIFQTVSNRSPLSLKTAHRYQKHEGNNKYLCDRTLLRRQFGTYDPYTIYYILRKRKIYMECNGYVFRKHAYVMRYYNLLHSNSYKRYLAPLGGFKHKYSKTLIQRMAFASYSYLMLVKNNPFSKHIWFLVWEGCGYDCFSKNDYLLLRKGFISEINLYRRLFGVPSLIEDDLLDVKAFKYAKKNSIKLIEIPIKSNNNGYVTGIFPREMANLFLIDMFDSFIRKYDFTNYKFCKVNAKQTQLIWKNTKKIGVGIATRGTLVFIVIILNPKGNIEGQYQDNVLPVQKNVAIMYGAFKHRASYRKK